MKSIFVGSVPNPWHIQEHCKHLWKEMLVIITHTKPTNQSSAAPTKKIQRGVFCEVLKVPAAGQVAVALAVALVMVVG